MQNVPAVDSTGSDLLGSARASERTRCATGLLAWPEEPTSIGNQKRINVCSWHECDFRECPLLLPLLGVKQKTFARLEHYRSW